MTARNRSAIPGFEPVRMAGEASTYQPYSSYRDHYRRRSSPINEGWPIDEAHQEEVADHRPFVQTNFHISKTDANQVNRNPSLLRTLTTNLRGNGSVYRSRPSQRRDYANIQDSNADVIPVDLSTLEGLGIELKEYDKPYVGTSSSLPSEDTAYRGNIVNAQKPSFAAFQQLGKGMIIGARLEHDPSKAIRPPSRNQAILVEDSMERMETVRKIGKDLAQEKGQMVAYSEGVDLSSLEGAGLKHRSTTTFDEMPLARAGTVVDTESYFFPSDPELPNWRPFSMRAPYMVMLTLIAFGLAIFQEYLCQVSLRKQKQDPPTALLAFDDVEQVKTWWFFVWKYLPTMITIFYSVLFSIMDFDIRRLEPFYQLSRPSGARASASLNLDHLTMFQYFVPFKAARLGQWAVFASTFANIIAATIAPALQNPSVNFTTNPGCQSTCENKVCPLDCSKAPAGSQKFWVIIDPIWSRLLTTSYSFVGLVLIFLFIQLRRKSGLLSDPRGIAGIASMATKSHILQDFKGLDIATRGEIHKKLAHRTYLLYKSSIWQGEWSAMTEKPQDSEKRLRSPHPMMLRLEAGIPFILCMFFCLGGVLVISLTPARIVPNSAPWLPILVATILKLIWSTFEADVRLMEPFYQLSKGNCLPQNSLTLDYQSLPYGWMPIRATFNRHYLVALVGISSMCLDILSVTIGSFSVDSGVFLKRHNFNPKTDSPISNQDETYISFWVSLMLSVLILIFVICVSSLVYARRRHPFLPREPSTIAAVLSFIYSSKMLTDFIDTEDLDHRAMEARLKNLNKRYGLGWFKGRDGQAHCAIDEEPMLSKYTHGAPYSDAVSGPLQHQETFYLP